MYATGSLTSGVREGSKMAQLHMRIAVVASPNTGSFPVFERQIAPLLMGRPDTRISLTSNARELVQAMDDIFEWQPDIIIICGGDGAMHVCLSAVADRYQGAQREIPLILMLALGTMNDGATALGVARNPVGLLHRVLKKIDQGKGLKTRLFRPMTVNGMCAFLYGSGLPVAFLQRYYRDKPPGAIGGPIGSGMTVGTVIWSEILLALGLATSEGWFHRLLEIVGLREATGPVNRLLEEFGQLDAREWGDKDVTIKVASPYHPDGAEFERYTGLMATVIDQVGMGLRAFRDAMKHSGSFTLRITDLGLAEILAVAPAILTGMPVDGIEDHVLKEAIVQYSRPTVRMIDGDLKDPANDSSLHPTRDVLGMGPTLEIITG